LPESNFACNPSHLRFGGLKFRFGVFEFLQTVVGRASISARRELTLDSEKGILPSLKDWLCAGNCIRFFTSPS
jgi:hypothetical protein